MRITGGPAATGAVVRWAGHPATVAAVLVLAFNDQVAKRLWPGAVTGKVSDLAWMLAAPPVVALLLTPVLRLRGDRPAQVAVAVTALAFVVAKSGPAGGAFASAVWSSSGVPSRIVGDPTDLAALPVLALSGWLWGRARSGPDGGRRTAALLAVPLAVAAMVATSAVPPRHELSGADGRPVLDTPDDRWTSPDGGATWTLVEHYADRNARRPPVPQLTDSACTPADPTLCYRLPDAVSPIEASRDGGLSWQPVFDPRPLWSTAPTDRPSAVQTPQTPQSPQTSAQSPAPAGSPSGSTTGAGHWEHGQVMLLATDRGPAVLVHYPRRGLALRDADGTWSVRAYPVYRPTLRPAAPRSEPWARGLPVAVVAGWTAALAAIGARRLRTEPADTRPRLLAGVLGCQLLCLGWILLAGPLSGARVMWVLPGWLVAGVVSSWLLLPMTVLLCRTPEGRARLPRFDAPLVGTVVGALALVPYLLWAHGSITAWSRASHLVLCCAVAGAAVGALCGSLPRRGRAGVPVERRPLGRATRR